MHRLLERQLRRLGLQPAGPGWDEFLAAVDAAYSQADRDRALVERSLELASQELLTRNRELRADIERRKQLELELSQAEKLRAEGQLASGIAHELNTPIQYVGDNLAFLQRGFRELAGAIDAVVEQKVGAARDKLRFVQQNIPGALDAAREGCERVAEIVSAMKVFAHPDGADFSSADINRALTSTLAVARNELKYTADVQLQLGELPPVECHVGELNQVFLNLITNAGHAIIDRYGADGPRGTIGVSSRASGDRVVVEISDNGCGIPAAIQPRIFEPFFTTKEVGRGTGQGLAISRSIVVDRHGGALYFRTKPGEGTTFVVEIPRVHRALNEAPPSSSAEWSAS
jgi:signal transduction histidine kinase